MGEQLHRAWLGCGRVWVASGGRGSTSRRQGFGPWRVGLRPGGLGSHRAGFVPGARRWPVQVRSLWLPLPWWVGVGRVWRWVRWGGAAGAGDPGRAGRLEMSARVAGRLWRRGPPSSWSRSRGPQGWLLEPGGAGGWGGDGGARGCGENPRGAKNTNMGGRNFAFSDFFEISENL